MVDSLSQLPREVFSSCIVPYLSTTDKHRLLSLCKQFIPLLLAQRFIRLERSPIFQYTESIECSPNYFLLEEFEYSAFLRQYVIDICHQTIGCTVSSRRRCLRIIIDVDDAWKLFPLLIEYIDFIDVIHIVKKTTTADLRDVDYQFAITCSLQHPLEIDLHLWAYQYQQLQHLDVRRVEVLQPSTFIASSNSELSATEVYLQSNTAKISQKVFQDRLPLIVISNRNLSWSTVISSHQPSVNLMNCHVHVDMQSTRSLDKPLIMYLNHCMIDFALVGNPLKYVQKLTLENFDDAGDLSSLIDIRELVLIRCHATIYPRPSGAGKQDWTLIDMNIENLQGYEVLHRLCLIDCRKVKDINMLGSVKHLLLDGMEFNYDTFPIPTDPKQSEWEFISMDINQSMVNSMQGLNKLTLCYCEVVTGCIFNNITTLHLFEPTNSDCLNFTNVQNLLIIGNEPTTTKIDIDCLNVQSPSIRIKGLPYLKSMVIEVESSSNLSLSLSNCPRLEVVALTNDPLHCEYVKIDRCQELDCLFPELNYVTNRITKFNNATLRVAVEMWCNQRSKALMIYGPINTWDVSEVTDMSRLFDAKIDFNDDISHWNTSNVTTMRSMFAMNMAFNQPLASWNTNQVKDMSHMFYCAKCFNQPLDHCNTSNVIDLKGIFYFAYAFNQPLESWDTSNVTNMQRAFSGACSFNQPLASWNTSKVTSMKSMFESAIVFNFPIGSWDTSNVTDMSEMFYQAVKFNQPIGNWNTSQVAYMHKLFQYAQAFNQPIGNWDVSKVTNMSFMFAETVAFNQPIGNWNTNQVIVMSAMFHKSEAFNQPIDEWDVSNVADMKDMFVHSKAFNQSISSWEISPDVNKRGMFNNAFTSYKGK